MPTRTPPLAIQGGNPAVPPEAHRKWPLMGRHHERAVLDAMRAPAADLGSPLSPYLRAFETAYAGFSGAKHCIAVNSGTTGLRLALLALGVGSGDDVVTSAHTFASGHVAPLIGARTLFADIDPRTFNMTPDTLRAVLTPRTKVVIVPHINGLMADMPGLLAAAPEVLFIEDAAQAAGATLNGRHAGTWGAYGVFSGNVQKPLQTIDGGWLTTNDDDRARSMRLVSCFGEERVPSVPGAAGAHWARHLGDQGRMHTLAAALGVVGLDELPELLATARHLAKILITVLNDLPGFLPPEIPPGYQSTFHLFRVLLDPVAWEWDGPLVELRDRVLSALIAEGVSAGIWGAFPQPALPVFRRVGGRPRPFVPGEEEQPLRAWDPSRFPVASRVIEGSIVLGRVPHPLQVQTPTLIEHYGRAFTKVWHNRHAVLSLPYERLRLVPEIDPADL